MRFPFFRHFRYWEPNPVFLFELRRAVRNRYAIGLMLLYLPIAAAICFDQWYPIFHPASPPATLPLSPPSFIDQVLGLNVGGFLTSSNAVRFTVSILIFYYAFTTLTLILFAAVRTVSDELQDSPVLHTLLSPYRIVMGKMLFGVVIGLVFLSITLPFLIAASVLNSLDIRIVFCGILWYFFLTQIQYLVTVTVFAGAKSYTKIVTAILVSLIWQLLIVNIVIHIRIDLDMNDPIDCIGMFLSLSAVLTVLFLFATTKFAPKTSNRMFPLRVTLTSIQLLIFILVLIGLSVQRIIGYLPLQSLLSDIIGDFHLLVPLLFLYCICEPETVFKRIKRTIPLSFSKRLFLFPFYTGAANAMVWCVLTLFIEGVLLLLFSHENPTDKTNDIVPLLHGCFNFGLLIFNYCATTLLIYHLLLRRWISRSWNWVFPFVFVAVIILFLVFTNWIANRFFSAFINPFALLEQLPLVPNPISAFIVSDSLREMSIEMIWFAVLAVTGFRWLRRHFKAFRQDQE